MVRTVFTHLNILASFLILMYLQMVLGLMDRSGNLSHWIARLWGRWNLFCCGLTVKVKGRENILKDRPQIFFCNHQSYFDVLCILAYLPAQYRWLAKKELFRIPLFGRTMARCGYIPIDRSNPREAVRSMESAAKRIRDGTSLLVFPEGTRSPDGRLQPFKTGGAALAIRAQVPVVPMMILGTHRILPRGKLRLGRGPVELRIGEPISTEGLRAGDKRRLLERVRQAMMELARGVQPAEGRLSWGGAEA